MMIVEGVAALQRRAFGCPSGSNTIGVNCMGLIILPMVVERSQPSLLSAVHLP